MSVTRHSGCQTEFARWTRIRFLDRASSPLFLFKRVPHKSGEVEFLHQGKIICQQYKKRTATPLVTPAFCYL